MALPLSLLSLGKGKASQMQSSTFGSSLPAPGSQLIPKALLGSEEFCGFCKPLSEGNWAGRLHVPSAACPCRVLQPAARKAGRWSLSNSSPFNGTSCHPCYRAEIRVFKQSLALPRPRCHQVSWDTLCHGEFNPSSTPGSGGFTGRTPQCRSGTFTPAPCKPPGAPGARRERNCFTDPTFAGADQGVTRWGHSWCPNFLPCTPTPTPEGWRAFID